VQAYGTDGQEALLSLTYRAGSHWSCSNAEWSSFNSREVHKSIITANNSEQQSQGNIRIRGLAIEPDRK